MGCPIRRNAILVTNGVMGRIVRQHGANLFGMTMTAFWSITGTTTTATTTSTGGVAVAFE